MLNGINTLLKKSNIPVEDIKRRIWVPEGAESKSGDADAAERTRVVPAKAIVGVMFVFSVILCICIIAGRINSANSRIEQYYADAGVVCTDIINEYGSCKIEAADRYTNNNLWRFTGLSYARQIDFNSDGDDELIIAYNDGGVYNVEIWGYGGGDFVKLYAEKANTIGSNDSAGSWITIFHRSGKYYIGKITDEENGIMGFLQLRGKKFKETDITCEYDAINDIYAVEGRLNTTDFETIKLSHISASKAEKIQNTVLSSLDMFNAEESNVEAPPETEEDLKKNAYYAVIEKHNETYGEAEYVSDESLCYAAGTAVVDLIDFNADGNEELLLISRRDKSVSSEDEKGDWIMIKEPEYYMEIYAWNGVSANVIYENEGLSSYQNKENSEAFYILQKDGGKVNVCANSYVYGNRSSLQKASSRISKMNSEGSFETAYLAVITNSYGYSTYTIDGERVYRSEFKKSGYAVPYFCNEDAYDKSEFTVTFLQGRTNKASEIRSAVTKTQNTIKRLKSH